MNVIYHFVINTNFTDYNNDDLKVTKGFFSITIGKKENDVYCITGI